MIIRPIQNKDMSFFREIPFETTIGIRNLPSQAGRMEDKIALSNLSFQSNVHRPHKEEYLFVLEDLKTGKIGGICGIFAQLNPKQSCNFQIETITSPSTHPAFQKEMRILRSARPIKTASEICCLYLQPAFRKEGLGRLLSLSRFLFMAAYPQRFHTLIVAEMRGFLDKNHRSPFWDAIGHHFCSLSFNELITELEYEKINLCELIPDFPIYVDLLPVDAQQVIGLTHPGTQPALHMLIEEGFQFTQEIDILEGGPMLDTNVKHIRTIKNSSTVQVHIVDKVSDTAPLLLLSNEKLDFRACCGYMEIDIMHKKGTITLDVAQALNLHTGDMIRYVSLK
jgi:arginine N-succinyltransferase